MMTDPIADMLARIRNAIAAKHHRAEMPASGIKVEIARILKEEGYIEDFQRAEAEGKPRLALTFKYGPSGERVISGLQRVSRSGCRVYVAKDRIPAVLGGLGLCIISTSQGILSGEESRRRGLGGEVLCTVW